MKACPHCSQILTCFTKFVCVHATTGWVALLYELTPPSDMTQSRSVDASAFGIIIQQSNLLDMLFRMFASVGTASRKNSRWPLYANAPGVPFASQTTPYKLLLFISWSVLWHQWAVLEHFLCKLLVRFLLCKCEQLHWDREERYNILSFFFLYGQASLVMWKQKSGLASIWERLYCQYFLQYGKFYNRLLPMSYICTDSPLQCYVHTPHIALTYIVSSLSWRVAILGSDLCTK